MPNTPYSWTYRGNNSDAKQEKSMNKTFWLILRDRGGFAMETLNFSSEGDRETRIRYFLEENPAKLGYSYDSFEE